jgi:hypothetical protein
VRRLSAAAHVPRLDLFLMIGFAQLVAQGKVHRDISEGNILCDTLGSEDQSAREEDPEDERDGDESEDDGDHSSDEDYVETLDRSKKISAPIRTYDDPDRCKETDVYKCLDTYEFPKEEALTG